MLDVLVSGVIVLLELSISTILFFKWSKADRHFIEDLPFMFGASILMVSLSSFIKFLILLGILPVDPLIYRVRGIFIAGTGCVLVLIIFKLWFPELRKTRLIASSIYGAVFISLMFIWANSVEEIVLYTTPLIGVTTLSTIITFTVIHYAKRLPDVNSFLISVGLSVIFAGQCLKVIIPQTGILVLMNVVDIVGWAILALGVLAKSQHTKILNAIQEISPLSAQ
ncbi:MAG: hypothetical protein ACTSPL_00950 [Candidatus Odinarchaeia archaeon]